MPMSANEYIIVGVKDGKNVVFNADVPIQEQSLDDRIIESTIIADKVSTIVYSKVREALLRQDLSSLFAESHLANVSETIKQTLEESKREASERALAIYKTDSDGKTYFQACVPNYVQNPLKVGNRLHPTEKPVALLQFLISLYSKPHDVVLDGFGGSGSTGEAAILLDRKTIIVEREIDFFNKLKGRLEQISESTEVV
jgi:DNA modification methylase